MTEQLISAEDAAAILGVAEQTLRGWRFENRDDQPAFVRVGRLVRYRPSAIEAWIGEHSFDPAEAEE